MKLPSKESEIAPFLDKINSKKWGIKLVRYFSEITSGEASTVSNTHRVLSDLITCRAKLLNADWPRQRAFFLNQEGTFGNQEGMIT